MAFSRQSFRSKLIILVLFIAVKTKRVDEIAFSDDLDSKGKDVLNACGLIVALVEERLEDSIN
jgi:hypothetical protein